MYSTLIRIIYNHQTCVCSSLYYSVVTCYSCGSSIIFYVLLLLLYFRIVDAGQFNPMGHSTPKKAFYKDEDAPLDLSCYQSTPTKRCLPCCPDAPSKTMRVVRVDVPSIPYEMVNCDLDATALYAEDTIPYEDTLPMSQEEEGDAPLLIDLTATLPMVLIPDDSFQTVLDEMDAPISLGGEGCVCWDTRPWLERQAQLMCSCGAPH